jgi:uncharacterized membrane protein (DUF106 family)
MHCIHATLHKPLPTAVYISSECGRGFTLNMISIYLSTYLPIYLAIYLAIDLAIYLAIYLPVYLIYLFMYFLCCICLLNILRS